MKRALAVALAGALVTGCATGHECRKPAPVHAVARGDLRATLRGNSTPDPWCEEHLSGVVTLEHREPHPRAFRLVGLNFEHLLSGHRSSLNGFTPRAGDFTLEPLASGDGATLVRRREDDPWQVSSRLTYRVVAPHYLDLDFEATIHDPRLFDPEGWALFFFASYMDHALDPEIRFRGHPGPGSKEQWVASRPNGHPGEHYVALGSKGVVFDPEDPNLAINCPHEEWPRVARPFYWGRLAGDMVYAILFDRLLSPEDEIRFTVMRWWLPRRPSPAWDFAYVARRLTPGKKVGFRARVVWKPFVSPEDVAAEHERWVATPGKR